MRHTRPTRVRRAITAVMSVGILAGCAATSSVPPANAPSADNPVMLETREFLDYVTDRTASRLAELCWQAEPPGDCARESLLSGFDATGEARRGCFEEPYQGDRYKCVLIGAFTHSIAQSAHLDEGDHLDWSDLKGQLGRILKTVASKVVAQCDTRSCATGELAKLMSLSKDEAAGCVALPRKKDLTCVMHTHLLRVIDDGLARMQAPKAPTI